MASIKIETGIKTYDIVNENDLFRINFISCTPEDKKLLNKMTYNLTIQIVIQTNDNY